MGTLLLFAAEIISISAVGNCTIFVKDRFSLFSERTVTSTELHFTGCDSKWLLLYFYSVHTILERRSFGVTFSHIFCPFIYGTVEHINKVVVWRSKRLLSSLGKEYDELFKVKRIIN